MSTFASQTSVRQAVPSRCSACEDRRRRCRCVLSLTSSIAIEVSLEDESTTRTMVARVVGSRAFPLCLPRVSLAQAQVVDIPYFKTRSVSPIQKRQPSNRVTCSNVSSGAKNQRHAHKLGSIHKTAPHEQFVPVSLQFWSCNFQAGKRYAEAAAGHLRRIPSPSEPRLGRLVVGCCRCEAHSRRHPWEKAPEEFVLEPLSHSIKGPNRIKVCRP